MTGGAGALAWAILRNRQPPIPSAGPVASAYLSAWSHRDWVAMAARVDSPPPDFATTNSSALTRLGAATATFSPLYLQPVPGGVQMVFRAHLVLAGLGPWDYRGTVPLRVRKRHWLVEWSPAVINPALGAGLHLARTRTMPPRAAVLAADGTALSAVPGAAAELVGGVTAATPADAVALGASAAGDRAGTSGLEAAFNAQLSGSPSGDILVADAAGQTVRILHHFAGTAPRDVHTTINPAMQALADRVLAPVAQPAAFVALDPSTGEIRAIVSHPDGGFPRALVGRYPAGSTFKVVTATAAITAGLTPTSPVDCPPAVTVDGRSFTNAEHEALGTITFEEAFAKSCNTAFINVARTLSGAQLEAAARIYGIGTHWPFPLPHFDGDLPPTTSPVEHVADAIGQGRVTVSPLVMASIAAAAASGTWQPPRITSDAPPGASTTLPPAVITDLHLLMRAVVTGGTGTAANLPGDPVYAKTGTAEYGTANPPASHAWFIGWRDNVAFAVLVEGGGFGGDTAAPLAAQFLGGL